MKKKLVGILVPLIIVVGVLGTFVWPNPVKIIYPKTLT